MRPAEHGEIAGKKIEVIYEDTETQAEVAVKKATKLLEENQVTFPRQFFQLCAIQLRFCHLQKEYQPDHDRLKPAAADSVITGSKFNGCIFSGRREIHPRMQLPLPRRLPVKV